MWWWCYIIMRNYFECIMHILAFVVIAAVDIVVFSWFLCIFLGCFHSNIRVSRSNVLSLILWFWLVLFLHTRPNHWIRLIFGRLPAQNNTRRHREGDIFLLISGKIVWSQCIIISWNFSVKCKKNHKNM